MESRQTKQHVYIARNNPNYNPNPSPHLEGFGERLLKLYVKALGGKMWSENNADGKGITVWIRLPREASKATHKYDLSDLAAPVRPDSQQTAKRRKKKL